MPERMDKNQIYNRLVEIFPEAIAANLPPHQVILSDGKPHPTMACRGGNALSCRKYLMESGKLKRSVGIAVLYLSLFRNIKFWVEEAVFEQLISGNFYLLAERPKE
jgi:hypothetical protein